MMKERKVSDEIVHDRYFDRLEIQTANERAARLAQLLPQQIERARRLAGYQDHLGNVDAVQITDRASLSGIPVLRKSQLTASQKQEPPFGGFANKPMNAFDYFFQSPGPIYEPGSRGEDWWRVGRFLHAVGIGAGDVVQNCFGYHLTPAGFIFESGARAVGATVLPAGTGQTELQVLAADHLKTTAYAGTPDFLKVILDKADSMNVKLSITKAAVSGGALLAPIRQYYLDRGIFCLQTYATADLGNIAFESTLDSGLIVDDGIIVEIVTPGTGDPVVDGEVGEVVVTTLNPDYPLIRFATGDLSAVLPGASPCGRTNMRIKGWMGRADQATKIKGMFVRPEQVAQLVASDPMIERVRVIARRDGAMDAMTVRIETKGGNATDFSTAVAEILKIKGEIEIVEPGGLPRDGLVIEDQRSYDN